MARYIDAEEALQIINNYAKAIDYDCDNCKVVIDAIKDIVSVICPAADVEEVRHGTWYHGMENGLVYAKCSACGRKMNYSCYGYARCSLCGARMDGEEK